MEALVQSAVGHKPMIGPQFIGCDWTPLTERQRTLKGRGRIIMSSRGRNHEGNTRGLLLQI
jgi:hypothetical protein